MSFKASVQGQDFHIRWNYTDVDVETPSGVKKTKQTTCIASIDRETVAEHKIKKYYLDAPAPKETVRKLTLGTLLRKMFPGLEHKDTRRAFWTAYLTRKEVKVLAPVVKMEHVLATSV